MILSKEAFSSLSHTYINDYTETGIQYRYHTISDTYSSLIPLPQAPPIHEKLPCATKYLLYLPNVEFLSQCG